MRPYAACSSSSHIFINVQNCSHWTFFGDAQVRVLQGDCLEGQPGDIPWHLIMGGHPSNSIFHRKGGSVSRLDTKIVLLLLQCNPWHGTWFLSCRLLTCLHTGWSALRTCIIAKPEFATSPFPPCLDMSCLLVTRTHTHARTHARTHTAAV